MTGKYCIISKRRARALSPFRSSSHSPSWPDPANFHLPGLQTWFLQQTLWHGNGSLRGRNSGGFRNQGRVRDSLLYLNPPKIKYKLLQENTRESWSFTIWKGSDVIIMYMCQGIQCRVSVIQVNVSLRGLIKESCKRFLDTHQVHESKYTWQSAFKNTAHASEAPHWQ